MTRFKYSQCFPIYSSAHGTSTRYYIYVNQEAILRQHFYQFVFQHFERNVSPTLQLILPQSNEQTLWWSRRGFY